MLLMARHAEESLRRDLGRGPSNHCKDKVSNLQQVKDFLETHQTNTIDQIITMGPLDLEVIAVLFLRCALVFVSSYLFILFLFQVPFM